MATVTKLKVAFFAGLVLTTGLPGMSAVALAHVVSKPIMLPAKTKAKQEAPHNAIGAVAGNIMGLHPRPCTFCYVGDDFWKK
jgi:hypothetical protein